MELDFFRFVSNITPTPPKLVVLQLKYCDVFAQIKVLHQFIVKSLPDHLVRVIHHLMHLDPYLVLDSHLSCAVGAPSVQISICHQSYRAGTARFYFCNCNLLFFFKVLKIFICDWSIAIFCASISKNSVLSTPPEINFSKVINCKIELISCCDSTNFHLFKIFNHFWLKD